MPRPFARNPAARRGVEVADEIIGKFRDAMETFTPMISEEEEEGRLDSRALNTHLAVRLCGIAALMMDAVDGFEPYLLRATSDLFSEAMSSALKAADSDPVTVVITRKATL